MRTANLWEYKLLPVHILFVVFLDVCTGATNENVAKNTIANYCRQFAKLAVYLLLSLYVFLGFYLLGGKFARLMA